MKIRIQRTHHDKTKDNFICEPVDFNHEMIGWEFQYSNYDEKASELIVVLAEPQDVT